MIDFKNVTIRNFMSYGDVPQTIQLKDVGKVLILGENRDAGSPGESANGVGKSSVQNAIIFALFGKGIEPIKTDEFINITNGKGLHVELNLTINDRDYKIVRKRKPNGLELYCDDESLTLDSMKNTQDKIIELIGMDYDVFVLLYFLSPSKQSFMAMSGAQQRDIIEKLLSLDTLTIRAEALKNILSELNTDYKVSERDKEHAVSNKEKAEAQQQRLKEHRDSFEDGRQSKIDELVSVINEISDIDFDSLLDELTTVEEIDRKISSEDKKISEFKIEKSNKESEASKHETTVNNNEKTRKKRDSYIEEKTREYEEYKAVLEEIGDVSEFVETVEAYERNLESSKQISKLQGFIKDLNVERDKLLDKIDSANDELKSLSDGVCFNCGQPHVDKDSVDRCKTLIDSSHTRIQEIDKELIGLGDQLSEYGSPDDLDISGEQYKDAKAIIEEHSHSTRELERAKKELGNNPHELDISEEEEETLRDTVKSLYNNIQELEKAIDSHISSKSDLTKEKTKAEENVEGFTRDEVLSLKNQAENAESELKKKREEVNPYVEELEQVEIPDVQTYEDAVYEIEEDIRHVKFLKKLLTDNNSFVRRNIVDMYIPFLNKRILEHSSKLDLPHVARVKNDMSVYIEYMGKSMSFFNMSAGERLRLNVATTLAFRELVSSLGHNVPIVLVDELFDGSLDTGGMNKVFRLVADNTTDAFIISHRDEFKSIVDKTMKIVKENGFSFVDK